MLSTTDIQDEITKREFIIKSAEGEIEILKHRIENNKKWLAELKQWHTIKKGFESLRKVK